MFPCFDLSAFEAAHQDARHDWARAIDKICRETEFLVLDGHGVNQLVIDNIWTAAQAFFAQDAAAKQAVAPPYQGYPFGYLGPDAEALARSKGEDTLPDLKKASMAALCGCL
jgi:isopenicillin N synthase-like dioxygenase